MKQAINSFSDIQSAGGGASSCGAVFRNIADRTRLAPRAAAACMRAIPRPVGMSLRDPAAIVAAGAEFHQHPTSEAHNPEADQHKKGRRRRDEEPALYDVHDPSPLASLTRDILPRDILRRWFGGRLYSNGGLFRITPFWCNPLRQTAPPAGVRRANVPLSCSSSQPFSIARRRPDLYSAGVPLI
jgi:hypothetical protein